MKTRNSPPRETKTIANHHEEKDTDRIPEKFQQPKRNEPDFPRNARSSAEQLRRPLPTVPIEHPMHSNAPAVSGECRASVTAAVAEATKYITKTFPHMSLIVRSGEHPEDLAYTLAADRTVGRRPTLRDIPEEADISERTKLAVADDTENSDSGMLLKYLDAFAARLCAAMICGRMSFVVERHPIDAESCKLVSPAGHESITTTWRREFFDVITNRGFAVRSWYERWTDESKTPHVEIVTAADMPKQQQLTQQQQQPETTA